MYVLSAYNQPAIYSERNYGSQWRKGRNEQVTFKNGEHLFAHVSNAMNGGRGQDTSEKPTADIYLLRTGTCT